VSALLRRSDVRVEVRAQGPRWADPGRQAAEVALGLPPVPTTSAGAPSAWTEGWLAAGRAAAAARDELLAAEPAPSGPAVARAVVEAADGGVLLCGSSLPVRDLDVVADDLGTLDVRANRGVAGIDGTVSTALGVALAAGRPTWALMGDLTFLHDANGLVLGPGEPRPDLCLVVADNDGGGIFATLEQGSGDPTTFERVFGTPHGTDLAALCAATRTPYRRVSAIDELPAALTPADGLRVVHVPIRRNTLLDDRKRLGAAVAAAVAPLRAGG
jgi:2-succinyl-5-enolpyruvyl-6-hydroxy-3-cyclohexene-1-carboxylate synthase